MVGKKVLVLGGAGFIGSNISSLFLKKGFTVTIIDGFLKRTGANLENIDSILGKVKLIDRKIQEIEGIDKIIEENSLIVDCMGWTAHRMALKNPIYDLRLNLLSHLYLIQKLRKFSQKNIIYLGSRGQYGKPSVKYITELSPMNPLDIQGINKLSAESCYRVCSNLYKFNILSLRIPNCFGPNQPTVGDDIGLVGQFIRDVLKGKEIEIYGGGRRRNVVYAEDLAEIIYKLSKVPFNGFNAYNIAGNDVTIRQLVESIISQAGKGTYKIKNMPDEIKTIEIGDAKISTAKLLAKLGTVRKTNLDKALMKTIKYFHKRL